MQELFERKKEMTTENPMPDEIWAWVNTDGELRCHTAPQASIDVKYIRSDLAIKVGDTLCLSPQPETVTADDFRMLAEYRTGRQLVDYLVHSGYKLIKDKTK